MQNLREESHISPRPETGGHLFGLNYPDLSHLITLPPISSDSTNVGQGGEVSDPMFVTLSHATFGKCCKLERKVPCELKEKGGVL